MKVLSVEIKNGFPKVFKDASANLYVKEEPNDPLRVLVHNTYKAGYEITAEATATSLLELPKGTKIVIEV
jgi:hypothetical protein